MHEGISSIFKTKLAISKILIGHSGTISCVTSTKSLISEHGVF